MKNDGAITYRVTLDFVNKNIDFYAALKAKDDSQTLDADAETFLRRVTSKLPNALKKRIIFSLRRKAIAGVWEVERTSSYHPLFVWDILRELSNLKDSSDQHRLLFNILELSKEKVRSKPSALSAYYSDCIVAFEQIRFEIEGVKYGSLTFYLVIKGFAAFIALHKGNEDPLLAIIRENILESFVGILPSSIGSKSEIKDALSAFIEVAPDVTVASNNEATATKHQAKVSVLGPIVDSVPRKYWTWVLFGLLTYGSLAGILDLWEKSKGKDDKLEKEQEKLLQLYQGYFTTFSPIMLRDQKSKLSAKQGVTSKHDTGTAPDKTGAQIYCDSPCDLNTSAQGSREAINIQSGNKLEKVGN